MSSLLQESEQLSNNGVSSSALESEMETLSLSELRAHINRCERLLQHKALLDRLPDKGKVIKERYECFVSEERRRKDKCLLNKCEVNSSDEALCDHSSTSQHDTTASKSDLCNDSKTEKECARHSNQVYELQIMEKYKDRQVAVEETVRRAFGSTLNETEIAKILNSVPSNYFLTYKQTCERAKETIEQMRENELQCLLSNVKVNENDKWNNNNKNNS